MSMNRVARRLRARAYQPSAGQVRAMFAKIRQAQLQVRPLPGQLELPLTAHPGQAEDGTIVYRDGKVAEIHGAIEGPPTPPEELAKYEIGGVYHAHDVAGPFIEGACDDGCPIRPPPKK